MFKSFSTEIAKIIEKLPIKFVSDKSFFLKKLTATVVSCELYEKHNLIQKIQNTSKIFDERTDEISNLDLVGDIRHKGMVMGIELVKNKKSNKPVTFSQSINKVVFEEGRRNKIYFRTLGNIIMLVPPLAISAKDLNFLIDGTIKTIKSLSGKSL